MSSTAFFTVSYVTDDIMNDLDARVVGIAENPNDPSARSFLFQRSLSDPTDQDRRLGMDTYTVSTEQGMSACAPLETYELTSEKILLNFTEEGADLLGVPQRVMLELALSNHEFETLSSGLREIIEPRRDIR
jgi:hypothetical protein